MLRRHTPLQIFVCDEESHFYSQVLEKLLLRNCRDNKTTIIEFGAGDGTPVINALLRGASAGCNFGESTVHGFELNPKAAAVATRNATDMGVQHQYQACPCQGLTCYWVSMILCKGHCCGRVRGSGLRAYPMPCMRASSQQAQRNVDKARIVPWHNIARCPLITCTRGNIVWL